MFQKETSKVQIPHLPIIKLLTKMKYNLIWGALFDMISPQVAKQVGGRLGEVEEVEWKKRKDDVNFFM